MAQVQFDQVSKLYADGAMAVEQLDLHVADGEFLCILGPSGCGKSSTIRMLAGLEEVTAGEIRIDSRRVNETPPQERDAAMIFENYALYPHLSSFENIAMPLRARRRSEAEVQKLVRDIAATLRIEELLERRPAKLSGGQRQRVAIGRAIVRSPKLFLMDEPLGHLEAYLRIELRAEIRSLQERLGVTTLYVTHDQEEAAAVADSIAIMEKGRLQQIGTFLNVLERPSNLFVASFIGEPPMNLIKVAGMTGEDIGILGTALRLAPETLEMLRRSRSTPTILGIRPQDIELNYAGQGDIDGRIILIQPQGRSSIISILAGGMNLSAQSERRVSLGETVGLRLDRERIHVFDESGKALAHGRDAANG
jgi:ABC-type sugar transport system ATPase subunit